MGGGIFPLIMGTSQMGISEVPFSSPKKWILGRIQAKNVLFSLILNCYKPFRSPNSPQNSEISKFLKFDHQHWDPPPHMGGGNRVILVVKNHTLKKVDCAAPIMGGKSSKFCTHLGVGCTHMGGKSTTRWGENHHQRAQFSPHMGGKSGFLVVNFCAAPIMSAKFLLTTTTANPGCKTTWWFSPHYGGKKPPMIYI